MVFKIIRNIRLALRAKGRAAAFILLKVSSIFPRILRRPEPDSGLLANPPKFVYIGPTFRCNIRCSFCLEHSPLEFKSDSPFYKSDRRYLNSSMEFAVFRRLVDDIHILGAQYIFLCGYGEPMLHPDFLKMCAYIKNKGLKCYIETNGTLLTKENIKQLVDIGVDTICVSINSGSAEVYQKVHNTDENYFPRIVENLIFLSELKHKSSQVRPVLSMGNVICRDNFRDIVSMVKVAIKVKAERVNFINFMYCAARKELLNPVLLNKEDGSELKGLLAEASLLAQKASLANNISSFLNKFNNPGEGLFNLQNKHIAFCQVQADGVVAPHDFPCQVGRINGSNFVEIWYSQEYINFRRKILELVKRGEGLPAYPFCRRCNAPHINQAHCLFRC